jgi:hypothetical protein
MCAALIRNAGPNYPNPLQLAGGQPCVLHRWELPDDHPARMDGAMGDLLVLGADDRLVLRQ